MQSIEIYIDIFNHEILTKVIKYKPEKEFLDLSDTLKSFSTTQPIHNHLFRRNIFYNNGVSDQMCDIFISHHRSIVSLPLFYYNIHETCY